MGDAMGPEGPDPRSLSHCVFAVSVVQVINLPLSHLPYTPLFLSFYYINKDKHSLLFLT